MVWFSLGNANKALHFFQDSLQMKKNLYSRNHPSIAISLNNLGSVWNALGDLKKSLEYFNQAAIMEQEINRGLF